MPRKGLFINFEGIDGSGSSTHVHELAKRLERFDKYLDIMKTHEPWKSREIKKRLEQDSDAYSSGREMAHLYVEDRTNHVADLILPSLELGVMVLNSRYKMSTCAYQWTQGVPIEELLRMHHHRNLPRPDLTLYLDVPQEIARQRLQNRPALEKFEKDQGFVDKLIQAYHTLIQMSQVDQRIFGKVIKINGNREIKEVAGEIFDHFLTLT